MSTLVPRTLVLVFLFACGGGSTSGPDAGRSNADAGPMLGEAAGVLSVVSDPDGSYIGLDGTFNDGAPIEVRLEMARSGQCRWMKYTPALCDPACDLSSEMCVNGACQAFPSRLDKGSIEWTWPGGQTAVQPDGTNFYSASGNPSAHGMTQLTVNGETLAVETSQGPMPSNDWAQAIATRSGDAVIRWSNPISGARVRLSMTDCVGSHGGIGETEIECEGPDTGELALPDEFLTALEAGDWSRGECGSHSLVRYVHDEAADGTFRFEARSFAGFFYVGDR